MVPRLAPLIFIVMPLVEIAVFVLVGSHIGVLATIALVIASTILGAILLRIQGFGILARLRETMEQGGRPGLELVHGFMVMVAGVLLILPGFVTDVIGLVLFIPPVRDLAWRFLSRRIIVVDMGGSGFTQRRPDSRTIDLNTGDYSRDDRPDHDHPALGDDR